MKFTAFGSIIALALIGVVAAAPPKEAGSNPAQPNSPGTTSTQPKTDPSPADCVQSNCKTGQNVGSSFCGNEAIDPACLNGHLFKSIGDGTACDLGVDPSCMN